MANTHFVANLQTGLGTLTLKVFTRGTNTIINTGGDTAAEDGTRAGFYDWTVSENVTGIQDCVITNSGGAIVAWLQTPVNAADDTNTYVIEEIAGGKVDVNTIKTQSVTCSAGVTVSPYVGSTGAAINGTNANTLSSHDPGETLGTSTLTQTQVTGGAYSMQSSSCVLGDARVANLDATVSSRATNAGVLSALGTGTWLTAIPWNAAWDAEVQSECADALTAYAPSTHSAADVWAAATRTITGGTITAYTGNTPQTGDAYAIVNNVTYGNEAVKTAVNTAVTQTLDTAIRGALGFGEANADTQFNNIYGVVGLIQSKTDNLPADPADASDIAAAFTALNTKVDTIDDFLDTEVAAIKAVTDQMVFTTPNRLNVQVYGLENDTITSGVMATDALGSVEIAAAASVEIATAVWALVDGIETGVTPKQALQRIGATTAGKLSGGSTDTEVFVGLDGSTTRVTATVDEDGNRTAITYA